MAATAGCGFLLFLPGFLDESLAREADLVALDRQDFYEDLVAEFQLITNVADAVFGDFADVEEAVGAGEELDECAKLRQANDFAEIGFADFGGGGDVADHLQGRIAAGAAGGEDMHGTVFEDIDFDAGGLDNGLDFLAARTDEVADLVLRNLQLEEARGVGGNFRARLAERLLHGVQDLQTGFLRLREGFAHHGDADAENLDVHLERGDSCASARDFEVHVAVVIFGAGDICEDRILLVITNDEAHGDPGAGRLQRNAGIHESERAAANGGHRRRTIGFENVRDEAHGVGEVRLGRKQIDERALRESAVADFAASRAAKEFDFADAKRREVVVQHEAIELILLEEQVEALHVFLGAESQRGESLRFAAGKERGTVHAGEQADFAGNMPNLIERAAIRTAAGVQNIIAEDVLAKALKGALGKDALFIHFLLGLLGDGLDDFILQFIDEVVALFLGVLLGVESVVQLRAILFLEVFVDGLVERERRDDNLDRLELRVELLTGGDDLLDLRVAKFESIDDGFFGDFERAGLDHDNGFFGSGDDDVQQALLLFSNRRVGHELAIQQTNADASNGLLKRQIGTIGRSGSGSNGNHVGIIVAVRGEHHRHNLRFVAPGLRKERAHGTVNQARGEDFLFRRTPFALEETSGNFPGGIRIFAIVDGQRKKVAVVGHGRHAGGSEHDGVTVSRRNCAVGLLGNLSSFENEGAAPDFNGNLMWCGSVIIFRHKRSFPLAPLPTGHVQSVHREANLAGINGRNSALKQIPCFE